MPSEVTWRISPEVFHDLHTIISKHGIGMPGPYGINPSGPDAAALEIREKYELQHLPIGTQLRVVVDFKMTGYEKPEYEG